MFGVIVMFVVAFAIIYTIGRINDNHGGNQSWWGELAFGAWLGWLTIGIGGLFLLGMLALAAVFLPILLPIAIICALLWGLKHVLSKT